MWWGKISFSFRNVLKVQKLLKCNIIDLGATRKWTLQRTQMLPVLTVYILFFRAVTRSRRAENGDSVLGSASAVHPSNCTVSKRKTTLQQLQSNFPSLLKWWSKGRGFNFLWVKRPKREPNQSPPCSARFKMGVALFLPHMPSWYDVQVSTGSVTSSTTRIVEMDKKTYRKYPACILTLHSHFNRFAQHSFSYLKQDALLISFLECFSDS